MIKYHLSLTNLGEELNIISHLLVIPYFGSQPLFWVIYNYIQLLWFWPDVFWPSLLVVYKALWKADPLLSLWNCCSGKLSCWVVFFFFFHNSEVPLSETMSLLPFPIPHVGSFTCTWNTWSPSFPPFDNVVKSLSGLRSALEYSHLYRDQTGI